MRRRFVEEAPRQAQAMLGVIERIHPGCLAALRDDPLGELGRWPDVQVVTEPEVGEGRCSVAGSYRDRTDPPTLVVGASRSYRRRGFTGLHELGHHLQQTDPGLGQALFATQDSEAFEDAACDAFAARVLLPEGEIPENVRLRGPSATDVVELFQRSQASREACCVRAAEYLSGGAVVLLDRAGTAVFSSSRSLVPPARGSDQSRTPLIERALRTGAMAQHDKTYVEYRSGRAGDVVYGQAAWCDEQYLVAVLVPDNAPWLKYSVPRPGTGGTWYGSQSVCETCGEAFEVSAPPCEQCGDATCPEGHCACTSARMSRDRACDRCFLVLAPSRFDGTGRICRDCA
ncbi:ImmA/IrrE family metallo-endopeptidase [Streptomyces sp. NPDC057521]|uniref:ImmA/IrrE family metallo-endopeptidase n=1 Tax=Streptomyces sp. NPDC057521 TaxID=3346156 RepID=UPI00368497FE